MMATVKAPVVDDDDNGNKANVGMVDDDDDDDANDGVVDDNVSDDGFSCR